MSDWRKEKPGMYRLYLEDGRTSYPYVLEIPPFKTITRARQRAWLVSLERNVDVFISKTTEMPMDIHFVEKVEHKTVVRFAQRMVVAHPSQIEEGVRLKPSGSIAEQQGLR